MTSEYRNIDRVSDELHSKEREYRRSHKAIRLNFKKSVRDNLSIKRSDVFTHSMHKYPGRLLPYIPIAFLSSEKYSLPNDIVLDAFAGSGTVMLESIVNPFYKRPTLGVEINPLARLISKVKTTPLNPEILSSKTKELFNISKKKILLSDYKEAMPSFSNINLWFSPKIKRGLSKLKFCIDQLENDDFKDFFLLCFSSIIRQVSKADPFIPPPVVLKPDKYTGSPRYKRVLDHMWASEKANVLNVFRNAVHDNMIRINSLWDIEELKNGTVTARIIWDDARDMRNGQYTSHGEIRKKYARMLDNSIPLIITSPPYLSAQKYVRTTSLEMLWLGLASEDELRELNHKTVGNEKVSLGTGKTHFNITQIDRLISRIESKSKSRMLIVSEYFHEMRRVLERCFQVLRNDGYMILILGNNSVCGINVDTTRLLSLLAQDVGFNEVCILKDKIRTRGMITKRHYSGGLIQNEYVLILRKQR